LQSPWFTIDFSTSLEKDRAASAVPFFELIEPVQTEPGHLRASFKRTLAAQDHKDQDPAQE
jgi:hypothetical protein